MQRSTLERRCRGDEAGEIAIWWGSVWHGGSDRYARARAKAPPLSPTRIPDSDLATSECCAGERWCATLPLVCLTLTSTQHRLSFSVRLSPSVHGFIRAESVWAETFYILYWAHLHCQPSLMYSAIFSLFFETSGQYNPIKQEVEYFILALICSIQGKTKLLTCCEQFWKAWDLTWWIWDCAYIIISLYKSFRYTIVKKNTTN